MFAHYQELIAEYFKTLQINKEPKNLYEPISYILSLNGKRIRPLLTLMACDVFEGDIKKSLDAATAVEVFHNFSLIHDDIMDDAPLRRGQQTVHEKWDINTGILSGDAMLILAYQFFENYEPIIFNKLARLFSETALQVCEGQQYDVDFESRNDVKELEYIQMIQFKTAVLIGAAMKMGAIVAEASEKNTQLIYEFGVNLGIAFQLQDDYLDAFGDPKTFGKQIGGDIIENKKTFLYIKASSLSVNSDKQLLYDLYNQKVVDPKDKIELVKRIFETTGAVIETEKAIQHYTQLAFEKLEQMDINRQKKEMLQLFGENLMKRKV